MTATFTLDMQDSCLTVESVRQLIMLETATGPARRGLVGAEGSTTTAIEHGN